MGMRERKRSYFLFSLVTTLIEEAGLAAIILLLLPMFGINVPLWLLALVMGLWAAYSYFTFRLGEKVIGRTPVVGAEALIGIKGVTTSALTPEGYVRIGIELWRARAISGNIAGQTPVTVKEMQRMTLFVVPEEGNDHDNDCG